MYRVTQLLYILQGYSLAARGSTLVRHAFVIIADVQFLEFVQEPVVSHGPCDFPADDRFGEATDENIDEPPQTQLKAELARQCLHARMFSGESFGSRQLLASLGCYC